MEMAQNNKLEVEIGCGKGKFLVARAEACPGTRFIGVDIARRWMRRGIERGEKRGLQNLEFIRGDVREVLEHCFDSGSVDVFHIYFPDPWPKRRQKKRRLIQTDFLELLRERLNASGLVEVATDDADYYRHILETVGAFSPHWKDVRQSVNERLFPAVAKTNYELKYAAEGRPIYYLELRK